MWSLNGARVNTSYLVVGSKGKSYILFTRFGLKDCLNYMFLLIMEVSCVLIILVTDLFTVDICLFINYIPLLLQWFIYSGSGFFGYGEVMDIVKNILCSFVESYFSWNI